MVNPEEILNALDGKALSTRELALALNIPYVAPDPDASLEDMPQIHDDYATLTKILGEMQSTKSNLIRVASNRQVIDASDEYAGWGPDAFKNYRTDQEYILHEAGVLGPVSEGPVIRTVFEYVQ